MHNMRDDEWRDRMKLRSCLDDARIKYLIPIAIRGWINLYLARVNEVAIIL